MAGTRGVVLLLGCLLLTTVAVSTQRQGVTPRDQPPLTPSLTFGIGDGSISGRIQSAADGLAVRGAEIVARLGNGISTRSALSDADGRYQIQNLDEGRWTVAITKAGYVLPQPAMRLARQPVKTVQVGRGGHTTLDFSLQRGSSLSGTVVDDTGEPAVGVRVSASRSRLVRGRRMLDEAIAFDTVDDTGAFRLHSLPAGDYYVAAAAPHTEPGNALAQVHRPTYFPGTANLAEAVRLSVGTGEDRSGIAFATTITKPVQLSGTLTDGAGRAVKDVTVQLLDALDSSVISLAYGNFGMSQDGGRFTFTNVLPGSYVLAAQIGEDSPETALLPIVVNGVDMSGVMLTARRGSSLSGVVAAAAGAVIPAGATPALVARAVSDDRVHSSPLDANGGFEIRGLVGAHSIDVERLPDGWMVESVTISGQAVTDRLIEFGGVDRVAASVIVTNRAPDVAGRVIAEADRAGDATVVVFSADPARWPFPSRYVQVARADANGAYRVRGLPPGADYLVVAVDGLDDGEVRDPDVLARLRPLATAFALGPGERKRLDLKVNLR